MPTTSIPNYLLQAGVLFVICFNYVMVTLTLRLSMCAHHQNYQHKKGRSTDLVMVWWWYPQFSWTFKVGHLVFHILANRAEAVNTYSGS